MTSAIRKLSLPIPSPFDWPFFLRYFAARSTPGVECVTDRRYTRSIDLDGIAALMQVEHRTSPRRLIVTVHARTPVNARMARSRVARMFDLSADMTSVRHVLSADTRLAPCIRAAPGLRVPGAWSAFEVLARAIVGQQVSVKAASTLMGRLAQRLGKRVTFDSAGDVRFLFPSPRAVANADLAGIGMPGKRVAALQNVARAIVEGTIPFDDDVGDVGDVPDIARIAAVKEALLRQPGIGPWTVEYFAMRALREADAWPGTDLVLLRACPPAARSSADRWRPWRAYAAVHLWNEAHAVSLLSRSERKDVVR